MKKLLPFSFLLLTLCLCSFLPADNLVGKWKGSSNDDIGYVTFGADGYVTFEIDGELMGGKDFDMEGERASMKYSINDKVKPKQIDIILTMKKSGVKRKMLGIYEMLSTSKMKVMLDMEESGKRPAAFPKGASEDVIILTRVK